MDSPTVTDDDIRRAWRLALGSLRELRIPNGFAASDKAGLYHAVFGRDTLWIALLLLDAEALVASADFTAWVRDAVADGLGVLARTQGDAVTDAVEEQPGRIIHELQPEPTAHALASGLAYDGQGRSFAGFDQTFLFVTAAHRFADRFPDDPRAAALWPHVVRAVTWIESVADEDGDGLYEYTRRGPSNLVHQVWKDSFDAVTHVGFDLPPAPVAWIDVQGYAFRALTDAAAMCDLHGLAERARVLRDRAATLRARVNEAYWVEPEGHLAVALDGRKRQITMVTSNPGHALWAGVIEPDLAARAIDRLVRDDIMTEYGVRTLAASSSFYAPFAYHRGNIWPHDNAIVASGLIRYGAADHAYRIMAGVIGASLAIGSPIELYIALDTDSMVDIRPDRPRALLTRNGKRQNQIQGFSAAALLLFSATLAHRLGLDVASG